jgi:hypothetical protein
MPYAPVDDSQFEFDPHGLRHIPTGAFFSVDPGQVSPKSVNWSRAGDVLDNGEEYDKAEIKMIAEIILAKRGPRPDCAGATMDIRFVEEDVHVEGDILRMSAFHEGRPITCYASLTLIADLDQAAIESGKLRDLFATAKTLQPLFVKRIESGDFDDDNKSSVKLRFGDTGR